jgi:glucose/arabinose dehydrogenase/regulation of enolase protein 1 (concanavalin A-like superfamily)
MQRSIFILIWQSLGISYRPRLVLFGLVLILTLLLPATTRAATVPVGFEESVVFSGLTNPTAVRFASDGRVFVAEKSGVIKVFNNLDSKTPTIFADLRTNVHNFWDRGLLSLALDPHFPSNPYVYVLYTHDAPIGGTAPRWGTVGGTSDPCPNPPGATSNGCVVSGRLSRLQAAGNVMSGSEQVLIEDWCQQYPSHSIGSLAFGADGALYVSSGDGASFTFVDYGQKGSPLNPCGDPPSRVGGTMTTPTAEGGALRSQDLRTSGDPVTLDGTILRVDPATGAGLPDNPLASNSDPHARRIIAYGLRNPFRITTRPGTNEVWIGDVGWGAWEEINRISNPTDAVVENFGWPCYEGNGRQSGYESAGLNICMNLYNQRQAITTPYFAYHHTTKVVSGETCSTGSSSIAGLAFEFYDGSSYPAEYHGALFFADYARKCIWAITKGENGLPAPGLIRTFVTDAAGPVDVQVGPNGDLFYVDFDGGTIRRIRYTGSSGGDALPNPWVNQDIGSVGIAGSANYANGTFNVQGSGADIADTSDAFHYVYQPLNGDGTITARVASMQNTDPPAKAGVMIRESLTPISRHALVALTASNETTFQHRLMTEGVSEHTVGSMTGAPYWVRLVRSGNTLSGYQSSDGMNWGLIDSETVNMASKVYIGLALTSHNNTTLATSTFDNVRVTTSSSPPLNQPPTATIDTPSAGTTWKVGDVISFSGSATDPEDGTLPASALSWSLIMHHCPSNCHTHDLQTFTGVASGSFSAPDHEYPSHLELKLTVTDSGGLKNTKSIQLDPQTVVLTFDSKPSGLNLSFNNTSARTPFSQTVIVESSSSISAPSPQDWGGQIYGFISWSDGAAQNHNITAPATPTTYTSIYDTGATSIIYVPLIVVAHEDTRAASTPSELH